MTPRFLTCLKSVLGIEGGVSNDPADRGGLTNAGVTQATYDAWRTSQHLPQQPVTTISLVEIQQLYWEDYWGAAQCYALPEPVDAIAFDMAVNSGAKQARMTLQRTLGFTDKAVDGVIGPKTLGRIASYQPLTLADQYLDARERFYYDICARDPSQKKFLSGWINRINTLGKQLGIARS
jgi:lysozyme family protein